MKLRTKILTLVAFATVSSAVFVAQNGFVADDTSTSSSSSSSSVVTPILTSSFGGFDTSRITRPSISPRNPDDSIEVIEVPVIPQPQDPEPEPLIPPTCWFTLGLSKWSDFEIPPSPSTTNPFKIIITDGEYPACNSYEVSVTFKYDATYPDLKGIAELVGSYEMTSTTFYDLVFKYDDGTTTKSFSLASPDAMSTTYMNKGLNSSYRCKNSSSDYSSLIWVVNEKTTYTRFIPRREPLSSTSSYSWERTFQIPNQYGDSATKLSTNLILPHSSEWESLGYVVSLTDDLKINESLANFVYFDSYESLEVIKVTVRNPMWSSSVLFKTFCSWLWNCEINWTDFNGPWQTAQTLYLCKCSGINFKLYGNDVAPTTIVLNTTTFNSDEESSVSLIYDDSTWMDFTYDNSISTKAVLNNKNESFPLNGSVKYNNKVYSGTIISAKRNDKFVLGPSSGTPTFELLNNVDSATTYGQLTYVDGGYFGIPNMEPAVTCLVTGTYCVIEDEGALKFVPCETFKIQSKRLSLTKNVRVEFKVNVEANCKTLIKVYSDLERLSQVGTSYCSSMNETDSTIEEIVSGFSIDISSFKEKYYLDIYSCDSNNKETLTAQEEYSVEDYLKSMKDTDNTCSKLLDLCNADYYANNPTEKPNDYVDVTAQQVADTITAADAVRKYNILNKTSPLHFNYASMAISDSAKFAVSFDYLTSFGNCKIEEKVGDKTIKTSYYDSESNGQGIFETDSFYYGNFADVHTITITSEDNQYSSTLLINGFEYIYLGLKQTGLDQNTANTLVALFNFVSIL